MDTFLELRSRERLNDPLRKVVRRYQARLESPDAGGDPLIVAATLTSVAVRSMRSQADNLVLSYRDVEDGVRQLDPIPNGIIDIRTGNIVWIDRDFTFDRLVFIEDLRFGPVFEEGGAPASIARLSRAVVEALDLTSGAYVFRLSGLNSDVDELGDSLRTAFDGNEVVVIRLDAGREHASVIIGSERRWGRAFAIAVAWPDPAEDLRLVRL